MLRLTVASLTLLALAALGSGNTAPEINLRLLQSQAEQSSTWPSRRYYDFFPANAIDGNNETFTNTAEKASTQPWWKVDLGWQYTIHDIEITNRANYMDRLQNVVVTVDGKPCGELINGNQMHVKINCPNRPTGQILMIQLKDAGVDGILTLTE
eukprot:Ihof_evm4s337 gene=Ihof_evmTU4s337